MAILRAGDFEQPAKPLSKASGRCHSSVPAPAPCHTPLLARGSFAAATQFAPRPTHKNKKTTERLALSHNCCQAVTAGAGMSQQNAAALPHIRDPSLAADTTHLRTAKPRKHDKKPGVKSLRLAYYSHFSSGHLFRILLPDFDYGFCFRIVLPAFCFRNFAQFPQKQNEIIKKAKKQY